MHLTCQWRHIVRNGCGRLGIALGSILARAPLPMKDWRTPEEEEEDRQSEPGLKLEAWGAAIVLAAGALMMLRTLFGW